MTVEFQGVVKGDDVRVRQACVDADFTQKAIQGFRIAIRGAGQRSQGFELAGSPVADLVSHARFGLVEDTQILVLAGALAGLGHGWLQCDPKVAGGGESIAHYWYFYDLAKVSVPSRTGWCSRVCVLCRPLVIRDGAVGRHREKAEGRRAFGGNRDRGFRFCDNVVPPLSGSHISSTTVRPHGKASRDSPEC